MGPIRQLVIAGFALVQAVLGARILLDLGVLPADVPFANLIVPFSDALAAPITALAERLGAAAPGVGGGLNPAIVTALVGWSVVEMVVLMIIGRVR